MVIHKEIWNKKSMCGNSDKKYQNITKENSEITCKYCLRRIKQLSSDTTKQVLKD